ncbi:dienelactone hydrolase family protein [Burkholderiaceae bacterium UC74_6]
MARTSVFLLCLVLASCAIDTRWQQVVNDPTPLGRDIFKTVALDEFESGNFESARGTYLPYRLLRPSKLIPGRTYPLVVQLHGSGGIGTDNQGQMERMAKSWAMPDVRDRYQAFVLIPQFPIRSANYGPASPDQHAVPSEALSDALELTAKMASTLPVDKSRIYASGFSMGGSATWLLPCLGAGTFAAIVPMSGIAPPDSQAINFINLPVLALHGDADPENPIASDRRFVQAIARHGGRQASLREYKGLEHQPPSDAYPGYWWRDWLFSQQRM